MAELNGSSKGVIQEQQGAAGWSIEGIASSPARRGYGMRGDKGAEAEYSAARSRSAALTQSGRNPRSLGVHHTGRA